MTILCWIDAPAGWRCEIKTSDGVVRPWDAAKPIAATCRYRAWDPRRPRDPESDPWMLPGDYSGPTTAGHRTDAAMAAAENEARFARPKYKRWEEVARKPKPKV